MSSVVAASTTYGHEAGSQAVVVKLTRTLMIIPICVGLGVVANRSTPPSAEPRHRIRRVVGLVPWFLIGFLVLAGAKTSGLLPSSAQGALQGASVFLITVALTAIGLSTDINALRRAGVRPLALGGILWIVVTGTSLLLQWAAS